MKPEAKIRGFPSFGANRGYLQYTLEILLFRKALLNKRVVIPATGFHEWKTETGMKRKVRYYFPEPDRPITWTAGFCNTFKDEQRFTMLTTAANDGIKAYHDRMPARFLANR